MNSPSDDEASDLRRGLEWQTACTKALLESQTRLATELAECKAKLARVEAYLAEREADLRPHPLQMVLVRHLRAALRGEP